MRHKHICNLSVYLPFSSTKSLEAQKDHVAFPSYVSCEIWDSSCYHQVSYMYRKYPTDFEFCQVNCSLRCLFIQLEATLCYAAKIISHDLTKAQTFCWTKLYGKVCLVCDIAWGKDIISVK